MGKRSKKARAARKAHKVFDSFAELGSFVSHHAQPIKTALRQATKIAVPRGDEKAKAFEQASPFAPVTFPKSDVSVPQLSTGMFGGGVTRKGSFSIGAPRAGKSRFGANLVLVVAALFVLAGGSWAYMHRAPSGAGSWSGVKDLLSDSATSIVAVTESSTSVFTGKVKESKAKSSVQPVRQDERATKVKKSSGSKSVKGKEASKKKLKKQAGAKVGKGKTKAKLERQAAKSSKVKKAKQPKSGGKRLSAGEKSKLQASRDSSR